jgi:hypothetical protein
MSATYTVSGFDYSERCQPKPPKNARPLADLDRGEGRGVWDPVDQDAIAELDVGGSVKVTWGTSQGGRAITITRTT